VPLNSSFSIDSQNFYFVGNLYQKLQITNFDVSLLFLNQCQDQRGEIKTTYVKSQAQHQGGKDQDQAKCKDLRPRPRRKDQDHEC